MTERATGELAMQERMRRRGFSPRFSRNMNAVFSFLLHSREKTINTTAVSPFTASEEISCSVTTVSANSDSLWTPLLPSPFLSAS